MYYLTNYSCKVEGNTLRVIYNICSDGFILAEELGVWVGLVNEYNMLVHDWGTETYFISLTKCTEQFERSLEIPALPDGTYYVCLTLTNPGEVCAEELYYSIYPITEEVCMEIFPLCSIKIVEGVPEKKEGIPVLALVSLICLGGTLLYLAKGG